jgi:hypothetical protein
MVPLGASRCFRSLVALLVAVGFLHGTGLAQPPGPRPPNTRELSTTEREKAQAAIEKAKQIVDKLNEPGGETGDGKVAKRHLDSFVNAQGAGRVITLLPPDDPFDPDNRFRACTWPDFPHDPNQDPASLTAGETSGNGKYREGQTAIQWCAIAVSSYALCDCALAVVILHEGHRLEQNISPPGQSGLSNAQFDARVAQSIGNELDLCYEDLVRIRAAREVCAPLTAQCNADLNRLEREARGNLEVENARARSFMATNPSSGVLQRLAPY